MFTGQGAVQKNCVPCYWYRAFMKTDTIAFILAFITSQIYANT